MDLRKEIQVALNNCQPNTNRVDKIEAIAQKYAELYHALQLQQTGVIYQLCECGGNERVALDCTSKNCRHPKYNKK
jgi:hypothetical protein